MIVLEVGMSSRFLKDIHRFIDIQNCDVKPDIRKMLKNTPLRVNTPFSLKSWIRYQDLTYFERPSNREVTGDQGIYIYTHSIQV